MFAQGLTALLGRGGSVPHPPWGGATPHIDNRGSSEVAGQGEILRGKNPQNAGKKPAVEFATTPPEDPTVSNTTTSKAARAIEADAEALAQMDIPPHSHANVIWRTGRTPGRPARE